MLIFSAKKKVSFHPWEKWKAGCFDFAMMVNIFRLLLEKIISVILSCPTNIFAEFAATQTVASRAGHHQYCEYMYSRRRSCSKYIAFHSTGSTLYYKSAPWTATTEPLATSWYQRALPQASLNQLDYWYWVLYKYTHIARDLSVPRPRLTPMLSVAITVVHTFSTAVRKLV